MEREPMDRMLDIDDHHWWFVGRRAVVSAVLPPPESCDPPRVLDAGCGSGRTLDMLRPWGQLSGIDLDEDALAAARARGHTDIRQCAVEELPWEDDTFGLITCMDVIEHTDDDVRALAELRRVLAPNGTLVTTVPAYEALWSSHDDVHQHRRRYRRSVFSRAARRAGFEIMRDTYFNATLLAPIAAVRMAERVTPTRTAERTNYEMTPGFVDRPLTSILETEARIIGAGHRLPWGLSLLSVLRKHS